MTRILKHLRQKVVAYVALFIALGGAGYAATSLPRGSVGPAQLNRHLIGGYLRAWAHVSATGKVLSGSPGAIGEYDGAGDYFVHWRGTRLSHACSPLVTLGTDSFSVTSVWASIQLLNLPRNRGSTNAVRIQIGAAPPNGVPDAFHVAVVC